MQMPPASLPSLRDGCISLHDRVGLSHKLVSKAWTLLRVQIPTPSPCYAIIMIKRDPPFLLSLGVVVIAIDGNSCGQLLKRRPVAQDGTARGLVEVPGNQIAGAIP
jgi:hypothetical protein